MKKFEHLGKSLSKEEQKKIKGGDGNEGEVGDEGAKKCGDGCQPGPNSGCPSGCPCWRRGNGYNCNYE